MVGWCSMGTFSDPCFWTEEMSLGLGYPTPPGSCDHHAERAVAASAGRLDTGTPWKQMAPGFFCWNMPCLVFFSPIFLIRSVASMLEQLLPCHCRRNPQVLGNVTAAVQPKICPANAWLSLGSCVSGNQKATRCFGRGRTCWFGAELETKKTQKLDRFSQHKSWFFTSRTVFLHQAATLNTSLH